MRKRLRDESGWAVVVATVVTAVMLSVGLALLAVVDNQQKQSGRERIRESSLNLAEGVVYGQGVVLTQSWPTASNPYPSSCTSSAAQGSFCPNRDTLAAASSTNPALANFTSSDYLASSTWISRVRDNGGPLANVYDPAQADASQPNCPGPCTYDANGDHKIWVEASSMVRGRPRAVVAQLQLEQLTEDVPHAAIEAGKLTISNNGNHGGTAIVDGTGSTIGLRCDPNLPSCASYQQGQVTPKPSQLPASSPTLMTAAQLQRLKQTAIDNNTYYPGCPTPGGPNNIYNDNQYHLEGAVVWVDNCTNPPQLANKTYTVPCSVPNGLSPNCINTPSSPGVLIWHIGTVNLSGSYTFCGLVYAPNDSDEPGTPNAINGDIITTNGGFGVLGGIAVDGQGGLNLGSNGMQIVFDDAVYPHIQSYGTAGLVQNTWRELPAGTQ
jgi:hypothetical protein